MSKFESIDPERPTAKFHGLCALGIMTKAPAPGKVKTRLTPALSPTEAAQLNSCFLRDLSQSIHLATTQAPSRGVAIYTPAGQERVYDDILPAGFLLIPQRGDSFDTRLVSAATDLFAAGFRSVCLINSDSPTVPSAWFTEAANNLAQPGDRVVIGPSADGGYYLIGLKQLHRRIFEEIDWSTERVFQQTMARIEEIGVPVHQLPTGFDVDDQSSLQRLSAELLGSEATAEIAPHTRAFLQELLKWGDRERVRERKL